MDPTKKFGLVMPKKSEKLKVKAKSIFDSDSEDDAPKNKRPVIPQKKISLKGKIKEELLEDSSIYEYDAIYDEMKAKQAESIAPKEKKNSRFIDTLLKAADKRKKEFERRLEKKIQVEREKEGDKFKDKEEFVTSAYKKKMQEREEEEERERREAMLNDMMDVTKQKDLSGFYRHFLKQTVGEEKIPTFGGKNIKQEVLSDEESKSKGNFVIKEETNNEKRKSTVKIENEISEDKDKNFETDNENVMKSPNKADFENLDRDSDGIEIDTDSDDQNNSKDMKLQQKKHNDNSESNSSESDSEKKGKKHKKLSNAKNKIENDSNSTLSDNSGKNEVIQHKGKPSSRDKKRNRTDSDSENAENDHNKLKRKDSSVLKSVNPKFRKSTDSYSDSENEPEKVPKSKDNLVKLKNKTKNESKAKNLRHDSDSSDPDEEKETTVNHDNQLEISSCKKPERKNIYAKRTVGDIFTEAQARYFQRVAGRN